jgi:hypothetical protein
MNNKDFQNGLIVGLAKGGGGGGGSSVQSDWLQENETAKDYIKNKPEKATIINENSTDGQYATAKAVYDYVKLENLNPAWDTTIVFDGGNADVQVAVLDKTILL